MKALTILAAALMFLVSFSETAQAQRSCQLVEQLAEELGCNTARTETPAVSDKQDFVVTSSYGPTQCKTGNALKDAMRDLKADCNTWLKERRSELKDKFQTGVCNEECTDCGTGLKKCTIKGVVHYAR